MKFAILPNGNLEISIENEDDREMIRESLAKASDKDVDVISDILEDTGWSGNGQLYYVRPEWVAALTEAPILTDELTHEDDGTVRVSDNIWWFPNYMVESFAETLLDTGRVVFQKAPE